MSCKDCRFVFEERDNVTERSTWLCRRFPPHVFVRAVPNTQDPGTTFHQNAFFPAMHPDLGWCGEFQPAKGLN